MIVVGCPACGDNVLAPSGVSTEANVRCPLCMEEFPLSAAFGELPPELIVLDQPAAAPSPSPAAIMPIDTSGGGRANSAGEAPAFQFEEGSAPVRPQVQVRQPATGVKPKNVIVEMLKVVLGGVLGLAIGQILLWRIPGNWPAHQRDPFHFGEKYGNLFPVNFLAPESVKDPDSVMAEGDDREYDSDNANRALNAQTSPDTNDTSDANANARDANASDTGIDDGGLSDIDPRTDRSIGGNEPAIPTALSGIRFAPRVTGSQLDLAVRRSELAASTWAEAEGDRTKELSSLVASLKDLAHAVTFIQPARSVPKDTVTRLRKFLPQFAEVGVREAFYQGEGEQFPDDDDALAGEVVVGEVTEISLNGDLFQTKLKLSSGTHVLILSVDDPRERFTVRDRILMLGVWITSPDTQLAGYESLDGPALFGEFPVRLISTAADDNGSDDAENGPTEANTTTPPSTDTDTTVPKNTEPENTDPNTVDPVNADPAATDPATID
jgi:hypothetical protein